jgi:hypothetical protein
MKKRPAHKRGASQQKKRGFLDLFNKHKPLLQPIEETINEVYPLQVNDCIFSIPNYH